MADPVDEGFPRAGRIGLNSDDDEGNVSPALSNYSSCEGSEFERYCSANSVMGTASVCSSIANRNDLLDSFKSLGLGEDLEGFGGGEIVCNNNGSRSWDVSNLDKLDGLSDGTVDSPKESCSYENQLIFSGRADVNPWMRGRSRSLLGGSCNRNMNTSLADDASVRMSSPFLWVRENGNVDGNDENSSGMSSQPARSCEESCALNEKTCFESQVSSHEHCAQNGLISIEKGAASKSGHSDDEDSMLGSGTDEEDRIYLLQKCGLQNIKAERPSNVNSLLMNSDVAFGNVDWDEFVQESGVNSLASSDRLFSCRASSVTLSHINLHTIGPQDSTSLVGSDSCNASQVDLEDGIMPSSSCQDQNYNLSIIAESCPLLGKVALVQKEPVISVNATEVMHRSDSSENLEDSANVMGLRLTCSRDFPALHCGMPHIESKAELISSQDQISSSFLPASFLQPSGAAIPEECKKTYKVENDNDFTDIHIQSAAATEVEKTELNEFFDEMVLEMEEILLDSRNSHRARHTKGSGYTPQNSFLFRDGSSTASTSGSNDACLVTLYTGRIEWIEVVGAKQKIGDVSFGERLVGVKEYTIYRLRIRGDKDQWEVERRYREFYTLYRQLKSLFADHGLKLPPPWSKVDQESRKIFGNSSPSVVTERSSLIQECLQSIQSCKTPFGTPDPLLWFLTPSRDLGKVGWLNNLSSRSLQGQADNVKSTSSYCGERSTEGNTSKLGNTITLMVEMKSPKSIKQLLDEQHYTCAGCHKCLDGRKTLVQGFVQTLGWGKPRLCEYTGQLFCMSCHTNDTAVLPARVLHHWDFSLYPVSQMAKAYLESIFNQPMLCVSAVNPFLFSKVPALRHVMDVRKKIGAMLPYIRCPFKRSTERGLGSRRYLLESNDFFALRDLVDLSKGVFAALPVLLENISNRILNHITQNCLECYDVGIPCAARQSCKDPSFLILPFQEAEAVRCPLCGSIFHEPCMRSLGNCPCNNLGGATVGDLRHMGHSQDNTVEDSSINESKPQPPPGFFSDLWSIVRPEKLLRPKKKSPVILMGSLPSNSL